MMIGMIKILRVIGSHGSTLVLLAAVAAVVAAGMIADIDVSGWIVLPAAASFVSLVAALLVQPKLKAQPALFAFHALLALLVVLVAADQLTAVKGHVEMTEGTGFDASLAKIDAGPLHPYGLDRVAFVQGPFDINYLPGMKRRETVSRVQIPDGGGQWREVSVGDDDPLIFGNYRFYTSFNKGFAPVITYADAGGRTMTGAVHMPSYPLNDYEQGNEWTPPGGRPVKLWLSLAEPVYQVDGSWNFRKPDNPVLVVIDGENRQELSRGEVADLGGGASIRFEALRSWMGYTITSNIFAPWIIATAVAACLSLAAHLWEAIAPLRGLIVGGGVRNAA